MSEYEQKLKVAMAKKGIASYAELAKAVGISHSYMIDIKSNSRKATKARKKIHDFLEIEGD